MSNKKEMTFKQWIELLVRSFGENSEQGVIVADNGTFDLSKLIPSITFFNEKEIKFLVEPYHIVHETDQLKNEYCEISDLRNKLEEYSHIYSIKLARRLCDDFFSMQYAVTIRGVKKA